MFDTLMDIAKVTAAIKTAATTAIATADAVKH